MSDLRDRVALVTGAGSGIGRAIALALLADGATVCLVGRRAEALEAVARDAQTGAPARVSAYEADLASDAALRSLADALRRDLDRLHILVHCAGAYRRGLLQDAAPEDFDLQYRVNLRAAFLLTQRLLPLLRAAQGDIVFINSTAGATSAAGVGLYATTKQGLKGLADSLRVELNPDRVRVLSVFPGRTATPMQRAVAEAEGTPYRPEGLMQPEDVAAMVLAALRLPRTAEVTDLIIRPLLKSS